MHEILRPDAVVTGPLFPEPVKVIVVTPFGSNLKLVGVGLQSGQVYQPVLRPGQVAQLQVSPPDLPFAGSAARFRLGVEALRLGLADDPGAGKTRKTKPPAPAISGREDVQQPAASRRRGVQQASLFAELRWKTIG